MDNTYGRTWRPLEDTAVAAQVLYEAGGDYQNYRRSVDYYPEGTLIWLEVDAMIRQLSKGAKSLDDFCRAFHGGAERRSRASRPTLRRRGGRRSTPCSRTMGRLPQPALHSTDAHAPLGGIERSGWKLVYDDVRSRILEGRRGGHEDRSI